MLWKVWRDVRSFFTAHGKSGTSSWMRLAVRSTSCILWIWGVRFLVQFECEVNPACPNRDFQYGLLKTLNSYVDRALLLPGDRTRMMRFIHQGGIGFVHIQTECRQHEADVGRTARSTAAQAG